jgi:hypothetical protein
VGNSGGFGEGSGGNGRAGVERAGLVLKQAAEHGLPELGREPQRRILVRRAESELPAVQGDKLERPRLAPAASLDHAKAAGNAVQVEHRYPHRARPECPVPAAQEKPMERAGPIAVAGYHLHGIGNPGLGGPCSQLLRCRGTRVCEYQFEAHSQQHPARAHGPSPVELCCTVAPAHCGLR